MSRKVITSVFAVAAMLVCTLTVQAQEKAAEQTGQQQVQQDPGDEWKSQVSAAERLQMMVQQICPVSGEKLGSMGAPVKIQVGDETAYLCCEGCKTGEISAAHWQTIQANIATAQGTCPVMGKPVDAKSESLVVDGRRVFICCPPCGPKIQADPATWFAKIDANRMSSVADQLQIAAQKICPVTGEELGSMGQPVKVMVGDEMAFLCCAGCTKKQIDGTHWKTVQANLAAAQGICPVMEKPLPENPESVVVNGRRIFVCCPPCIKKIQDNSAIFTAKSNEYLLKR